MGLKCQIIACFNMQRCGMMESSVGREKKLSKHSETCGGNMTDLADVCYVTSGMGVGSARQSSKTRGFDLRIYKCFGILPL